MKTFGKYLDVTDKRGEWVRIQGDVKVVADTFTKVVNKTVNSIRRKYTSETKAIEKLVKGYNPNYKSSNAIRIIK